MSKKKTNDEPELPEAESKSGESAEQQNIYEFQMSSTETATISQDDFWRIKLAT